MMNITIHLPDDLGKQIEEIPNRDDFLAGVVKNALRKRWLNEQTKISLHQADQGEYADEQEVKVFFDRWSNNGN